MTQPDNAPNRDASEIARWIEASNPRRKRLAGAKSVWNEVHAERIRAHDKHGKTSMESQPPESYVRLAILVEEVGEVARVFNEARHGDGDCDLSALRAELIQVAAMAGAWADRITL